MPLLPRVLTSRQSFVLAACALVLAFALKLFAPLAITVLILICAAAFMYGLILEWWPELVKPEKA